LKNESSIRESTSLIAYGDKPAVTVEKVSIESIRIRHEVEYFSKFEKNS